MPAAQVTALTSDLRGAGTDANVHLVMHGTLGDGDRHILTSGPHDFDRRVRGPGLLICLDLSRRGRIPAPARVMCR